MKKLIFLALVFALSGCASDFLNKPWSLSPATKKIPGETNPAFDFGGMLSIEQTPNGAKGTFIQGYGAFTNDIQRLERETEQIQEHEAKYCEGKKLHVISKRFDFTRRGWLYDFECK